MQDTIGIDISRDTFDIHRLSDRRHERFGSDKAGLAALRRGIGKTPVRIVHEATGRYHRDLEAVLSAAGHDLVKVNPTRARRFAQAISQGAKTDRVDAAMPARTGAVPELDANPVRSETMHEIRELHIARLALNKDHTACRNRLPVDADGREVVEGHSQIAVDQRADLAGKGGFDGLAMVHQRVHRPQQMLVSDALGHRWHGDGVQPAQTAELAGGIAQAVEDHGTYERLSVYFPSRRPQCAPQRRVDPELPPEFVECEDITKAAAGLLDDLGGGVLGAPHRPIEPVDQRIQPLRRELVEAPEVGHNARAHLAGVVSERLDQLQVLTASGLGDARVHSVAALLRRTPVISASSKKKCL
ncbi:transposase [Paracoccus bogoriensis]|nr:transposase [Paracoccus bogoriensis]